MTKKKEAKKKVLVVEDRENWRTTFGNFLKKLGYHVMYALNGRTFRAQAEKADVIIVDISMPMEPGQEEIKTAGLDVLMELQEEFPGHPAIQNPIIRSMWDRGDFKNSRYENANVADGRWCSRNVTIAKLLELIENTPGISG